MAQNTWTADRRLYLDKDGRAVEADDPTRVSLLVPAGGGIAIDRAQALGLIAVTEAEVKAIAPKRNKARLPPAANKSRMAPATGIVRTPIGAPIGGTSTEPNSE